MVKQPKDEIVIILNISTHEWKITWWKYELSWIFKKLFIEELKLHSASSMFKFKRWMTNEKKTHLNGKKTQRNYVLT